MEEAAVKGNTTNTASVSTIGVSSSYRYDQCTISVPSVPCWTM